MVARIAPTPSGFLHAGNRYNFEVTSSLAQEHHIPLALRIDDVDAARYKSIYADDIFRVLRDLQIEWTIGPRNTPDFEDNWAQRKKTAYYRAELALLHHSQVETYACRCSRASINGVPSGGCPGQCRAAQYELVAHESALRVHVPIGTTITINGRDVHLDKELGDFVIWRRDDLPAYQLVSVIEDRDLGTTHIVRGEDLLTSTAAQIFLAPRLNADNVVTAQYVHHPLLTDGSGAKLSKSR
jgi:glutamyl/glutaminyl-tRNA synthetase